MVQLKDVTPIIRAILDERDRIPMMINTQRYIPDWRPNHHGEAVRGGIRKALRIIEKAPVVDAVEVVRCRDCKYWSGRYDKPGEVTVFGYCGNPGHYIMPLSADWYCADGAKMDEGGTEDD